MCQEAMAKALYKRGSGHGDVSFERLFVEASDS